MPNEERDGFIDCGLAVVHPWLCDGMAHLTTRHYLGMFDDAAYHLFACFGYYPEIAQAEKWGWADVRHEINYRGELVSGDLVRLEGRVANVGQTSLTVEYRMFKRRENSLAATLSARTVCFDLEARKSKAIPEPLRKNIDCLFSQQGPHDDCS